MSVLGFKFTLLLSVFFDTDTMLYGSQIQLDGLYGMFSIVEQLINQK